MQEILPLILSLEPDNIKSVLTNYRDNENYKLFTRLFLVQVRNSISKLLKEEDYGSISIAAQKTFDKMKGLMEVVKPIDEDLEQEIVTLIRSLLIHKYPYGMQEFESKDLDSILEISDSKFKALFSCGLKQYLSEIVLNKILDQCKEKINEFNDEYEVSVLSATMKTLSDNIFLFSDKFPELSDKLPSMKATIYSLVVDFRAKQIFDIVASYPDSTPSLYDLRESCLHAHAHKKVAQIATEIFCNRLLHLGASTTDIVTQYISAIQALNIVDESGGLTRAISPPIQSYLTTRPDLLTTIVEKILEDNTLMDNSRPSAQKPNDDDVLREASAQRELDEKWNPEPLHSHIRDLQSLVRDASDSDALALLLNVYGSISSFVSQLEREIAARVESRPGYNFDSEVRAIEILKRRFGAQIFLNCEVILQDVADSKRLQQGSGVMHFQPLVASHMYWPELNGDEFTLPQGLAEEVSAFEKEFDRVRKQRKLKWYHTIGCVEIVLDFDDDETLSITVPPLAAATIALFNDKTEFDTSYVSKKLSISKRAAEHAISFWMSGGVIVRGSSEGSFRMSSKKPAAAVELAESARSDMIGLLFEEKKNPEEEENGEEEEDFSSPVVLAKRLRPFALTILQARPREKFTIDSYYSLLMRFVRIPKLRVEKAEFLKIIPIWVSENMITVDGENVALVK